MKIFFALVLTLFYSAKAFAACTSPAGVAGQMQYISGVSQVQFCNGTSWQAMNNTTTATACTPAGKIQYVSSEVMWCNGSVWVKTAPSTDYGACAAGIAGKFYYDGGSWYWFCNGANWRRMGP